MTNDDDMIFYLLNTMLARTDDPKGISESRLKDIYAESSLKFATAKPVLANLII